MSGGFPGTMSGPEVQQRIPYPGNPASQYEPNAGHGQMNGPYQNNYQGRPAQEHSGAYGSGPGRNDHYPGDTTREILEQSIPPFHRTTSLPMGFNLAPMRTRIPTEIMVSTAASPTTVLGTAMSNLDTSNVDTTSMGTISMATNQLDTANKNTINMVIVSTDTSNVDTANIDPNCTITENGPWVSCSGFARPMSELTDCSIDVAQLRPNRDDGLSPSFAQH